MQLEGCQALSRLKVMIKCYCDIECQTANSVLQITTHPIIYRSIYFGELTLLH